MLNILTLISLLKKWKQLSRLQRSVILFVFAFLAVCGVISYTSMGEPWKSMCSMGLRITGIAVTLKRLL